MRAHQQVRCAATAALILAARGFHPHLACSVSSCKAHPLPSTNLARKHRITKSFLIMNSMPEVKLPPSRMMTPCPPNTRT